MGSENTGYIALSFIGGILISLMAAGMYYASGSPEGPAPTGMAAYQRQYGGKKTYRKRNYLRKTRKL